MSTRATYRISEDFQGNGLINYFYIHYDGYPEGAANYFKDLLKSREEFHKVWNETYTGKDNLRRKTWAGTFEMGLPYSERTKDHECHGDTEFRYNLSFWDNNQTVKAYKRSYEDSWVCFWDGYLHEFIKIYNKI
jgi:hypothetical protein